MGRRKKFVESEVLEQAMLAFWGYGYEATTYRVLEDVTHVTGRSLVNTFGDKEALFTEVLSRYHQIMHTRLATFFKVPGCNAIVSFFEDIAFANSNDPRNNGCLMVNSMFEYSKLSPIAQGKITLFKSMLKCSFQTALEADTINEAESRADFLLSVLWGMASEIRLQNRVQCIEPVVQEVTTTITAWKTEF